MIYSKKRIWLLFIVIVLIVVVAIIALTTNKQQKTSTIIKKNNTENNHLVILGSGANTTLSTTTLQSTQSLLYDQVKTDVASPKLSYTGTIRPNSYIQLNENEAQLLVDIPSISATYVVDISSIDSSSGSIVNIMCPSTSQLAHKEFVCHAP